MLQLHCQQAQRHQNSISNHELQTVAILAADRKRTQLLDIYAVIVAFAAGHFGHSGTALSPEHQSAECQKLKCIG